MTSDVGVPEVLKQGAALTTLQNLFDNLDRAQELLGEVILDMIQTNWTPGKVKKVLEGEEPQPQFYNKAFGKYHIRVTEGLNTTTQKQMQLAQLLHLREIGIPIPDDVIIDAVTVQDKNKLIEAINAQKQKMEQMQDLQLQSELAKVQAETELAQARSVADEGLGYERSLALRKIKRLRSNEEQLLSETKSQGSSILSRLLKKLKAWISTT